MEERSEIKTACKRRFHGYLRAVSVAQLHKKFINSLIQIKIKTVDGNMQIYCFYQTVPSFCSWLHHFVMVKVPSVHRPWWRARAESCSCLRKLNLMTEGRLWVKWWHHSRRPWSIVGEEDGVRSPKPNSIMAYCRTRRQEPWFYHPTPEWDGCPVIQCPLAGHHGF